jgi:hypothetical protein
MTMSIPVPTAFELYFGRRAAAPGGHRPEELERVFFDSITLRNGTYKTTWNGRLDDLNALVQSLLPPQRPLEIMDVAVSSGISTAEWLLSLEQAGIECNMLAGDAVVDAFLISVGRLRALTDRTGHLMQLDVAGRAVRTPPPRRRDRVLYLPHILLMKTAARLFNLDASGGSTAQQAIQSRLGVTCQPLTLTSPSLAQMPRLRAVEDDILLNTSYSRRFHVLRAANILNLAYFDSATLQRMLVNLRRRLVPGGLLIVCRTNEVGINNASVFSLGDDGRLSLTARLHQGSEIADLVLRLPPEC